MKLQNLRLGLATNSSSSHSIIFNPKLSVNDDYNESFGWDFFTLASKEAKDAYAASMIYQNLVNHNMFSRDIAILIIKGMGFSQSIVDQYVNSDKWGPYGIDHQSLYNLPLEYGTNNIDINFAKEFREYLIKDGIIILGGNDNDDQSHPLYDYETAVSFGNYTPKGNTFIARRDGDWWTLFDPNNGTRATISFKDYPNEYKPETPLLVDLRVSSFCTSGCGFCFNDSSSKGVHMDKDKIYSIAHAIGDAEVFEVAIGGGDPIEFPFLEKMIDDLKYAGVPAVNFTTRQTEWLENEVLANRIISKIGAFALSVDDRYRSNIDRIIDIFKYRKYDTAKFTIQIIPAIMDRYNLKDILIWASNNRIRVTMLGYKETGRGTKFKEIAIKRNRGFNEEYWIEIVKELSDQYKCPQFAIDTTLAKSSLDILKGLDIPDYLYHITEGFSSMYIDAVENKVGPSSYHLDNLIDIKWTTDCIRESFAKIEPV